MKTRDLDFVFDGVGLKAFTKTVDGKELKYIGGVASSTAKDLYGDVISAKGQITMLDKLRNVAANDRGLTAWLNHSYKIPEDTLGVFESGSLATRTGDDGQEYVDLEVLCRVTDENPRALAAWKQVQEGTRHGWSIGAYFLDAEWANPDDPYDWGLIVNDVDLLEISLVGIPANQRAWAKTAADVKERAALIASKSTRSAVADTRELVLKALVHTRDDDDSNMSMDEAAVRAQMAMDCVDAVTAHGVCQHNAGQMTDARAHMAAIVNWDGSHPTMDAPQVATSDTCSAITAQRDALDVLEAKAVDLQTAIDLKQAELDAKNAEIAAAATRLAEIKTATDLAQKAYDDAQARSLGRRTVTSPATVRSGAESSVPAEAYGKPTTEYHRALGQQMSGVVKDARSSAP